MQWFFYAKIVMAVGEYADDHGFLLPTPVSIGAEYF